MDPLTALIFTDDDSGQPSNEVQRKLTSILLWVVGLIVLAGAFLLAKDATVEWRVTNSPRFSTKPERDRVALLNALRGYEDAARRARDVLKK